MRLSVAMSKAIFRQLFEPASSTYTYILGCPKTQKALIIDPVKETAQRDAKFVRELGLNLELALNTHVHADHVTGTAALREFFPDVKSALSKFSGGKADVYYDHGQKVQVGGLTLEVRATPGHTNGCVTYVDHENSRAFTGDALLVRACGRTDFQQGDAQRLYRSIWDQIYSLPDNYMLYIGHNYDGVTVTSVAEEKKWNPRTSKSEQEFVDFMKNLSLPYPKQINHAVPLNLMDGNEETE